MPCDPVIRILARVENAWCADPTHHLSRRRPSLSGPKEPSRSIGKDGRMVRQIFEVNEFLVLLLGTYGPSTPLRLPPRWPVRVIIISPNAITTKYEAPGDSPFARSRNRFQ